MEWLEWGEGGKQTTTTLCDTKGTLNQAYEQQFRLPLPNAKITEAFLPRLQLSTVTGGKPTTISRLEVRGRLAPIFGVGLDEKQGMVFAKTVFPNSLGQKAGIQPGDVVLAVNAVRPKTSLDLKQA